MGWTIERLVDEIDLLGSRGLPREEFFAELSPRLRNVIDNDASCWHTLDPSTRLLTSDAPRDLVRARRVRARRDPRRRGADRPQRVHGRRRQHLRGPRRAAGARRHPRQRHARRSSAQRALPRPAPAGGHPPRAARCVRHPRPRLGRRAHRPACAQRPIPEARRGRALRTQPGRLPAASARRCGSTRPAA